MALPHGIYRISQWGTHGQSQILTFDDNGNITVSPPEAAPAEGQKWFVETLENGNIAIQHPARIFPSRSLSYEGEPEAGKRIVPGRVSDFPTREWHVEPAPQKPLPVPYFIRVPDQDLNIVISPARMFPPLLILAPANVNLDNAWEFQFEGLE